MVKKSAWKTRNQDLTMEVTTGKGWKGYGEVGNDSDGENVETTTHDGRPPWDDEYCLHWHCRRCP